MNPSRWPPPYGKRPHPLPAPYRQGVRPQQWSASPGVVGAAWTPRSELTAPPRLVEWSRRRRKPLWAWGPRLRLLSGVAVAAVGAAAGLLLLT